MNLDFLDERDSLDFFVSINQWGPSCRF